MLNLEILIIIVLSFSLILRQWMPDNKADKSDCPSPPCGQMHFSPINIINKKPCSLITFLNVENVYHRVGPNCDVFLTRFFYTFNTCIMCRNPSISCYHICIFGFYRKCVTLLICPIVKLILLISATTSRANSVKTDSSLRNILPKRTDPLYSKDNR